MQIKKIKSKKFKILNKYKKNGNTNIKSTTLKFINEYLIFEIKVKEI